MAGIMMPGDEGKEVTDTTVPSIGGPAKVVASAHLGDAMRSEGVAYPETQGIAVTTDAYPAGTVVGNQEAINGV